MQSAILLVFVCAFAVLAVTSLVSRWIHTRHILLLASLLCFAIVSVPGVCVLLVFSILVYGGGIMVSQRKTTGTLVAVVAMCLTPLVVYKVTIVQPWTQEVAAFSLLEMIGISYFTFNGLSYVLDIRKGYIAADNRYDNVLLYLAFFPCIIAGPLHRYKNLSTQFAGLGPIQEQNLSRGFRLVLWGLFKNLVLAQRLKEIADPIFQSRAEYQGFFVLLGGLVFFFQLYCDFSSYVDIAMGLSRMMGIQLSPNFSNRVYASTSRTEFWKGWHQTLNAWFRDYLFFALMKGRANAANFNRSLLLTFVLIGLWHDLSLKFFIWGLLNGIWILAEMRIRKSLPKVSSSVWRVPGLLYHLTLASCLAVIFRSDNLMLSLKKLMAPTIGAVHDDSLVRKLLFVIPILVLMDQINKAMKDETIDTALERFPRWGRWSFYFLLALVIMSFGQLPNENPIYAGF